MDKNNDLFENNNINLLKGNIKKYFQKLENNNINLLEENIKKYFQKLENNNILYEPVQPAAPPVRPPAPGPNSSTAPIPTPSFLAIRAAAQAQESATSLVQTR